MTQTIYTKVNDFGVKYELNKYGKVNIYVDGELMEDHQHTWFMSALLNEATVIKENANGWRKQYEKLESIASDYIDEDLLNELMND